MNYEMIAAVSAVVASYMGAFKALKWVPSKYIPFISVAVAGFFFVVPTKVYELMIAVSIAGLSAVGIYKLSQKEGTR